MIMVSFNKMALIRKGEFVQKMSLDLFGRYYLIPHMDQIAIETAA